MDAKLIYSYLLSLTACLAVSCTADMSGSDADRGAELSFEASELTRVAVATGLDKFAVYGDIQLNNNAQTVIFDKTEVKRDPDNGKWSYAGPTQYWFPQHVHSFVAITPVSAFEPGNDPQYSNSTLSFKYTLPDNFESAHDLLVATHRRMYTDNRTSSFALPVRFGFFHILSRVNFLLKYDNPADKITVTKIELEGINKTGTFAITPASLLQDSRQTDDYSSSWADFSNKSTLTANINVNVADEEVHSLFPDDNAMFVIPQPYNKEIIMKITYIYDNDTKHEDQVLTAQEALGGWESGKIYSYSLTIKGIDRKIHMGPVSVKEWISGSDNDVDVPRK